MKNTWCRYLLIFSVLFLLLPLSIHAETAEGVPPDQSIVDAEKAAEQVDEAVAELSAEKKRLLATWLHLLDDGQESEDGTSSVLTHAPQVPADLARILQSTAVQGKSVSFTLATNRITLLV